MVTPLVAEQGLLCVRCHAAIERDDTARDIGAAAPAEKQGGACDILGRSEPAERDRLCAPLFLCVVGNARNVRKF